MKHTLHVCSSEQMRSLIHKNTVQLTLSTVNTNQLSLTVTVSLTLQLSNRRSFNCFQLTYAR